MAKPNAPRRRHAPGFCRPTWSPCLAQVPRRLGIDLAPEQQRRRREIQPQLQDNQRGDRSVCDIEAAENWQP